MRLLRVGDLITAAMLLTRFPLPGSMTTTDQERPPAAAVWAYPCIGIVLGLMQIAVIISLLALGSPASIAALVALVLALFATGAMHEDGLADCADGFWGGWTRERRLEIMKDSRIGTYGVAALVLVLAVRWQTVSILIMTDQLLALVAVETLSRLGMVWVMYRLPHARREGLSHRTGRPEPVAVAVATGIGIVVAITVGNAVLLLVGGAALGFAMIWLARTKIGGQTGDVLGAVQQVIAAVLLILLTIGT